MKFRFALFLLALVVAAPALAQTVTLPQIMQHPDWVARSPEDPYWSDDGKRVIYERKREGSEIRDVVVTDGRETRVLTPEEIASLSQDGGDWSSNRRSKVFSRNGDLFLKDVRSGRETQLTRTAARERSPFFLVGDKAVAFQRDDALLVRDLESGLEWQPAILETADDPDDKPAPDLDYLQRQQRDLLGIVRLWEKNEEEGEERSEQLRDADPHRAPETWYLGKGKEIRGQSLSPNGRWLLVRLVDEGVDRGQQEKMPNYVSKDGYTTVRDVRPKVGTGEAAGESFVLLDLETRERHDLDLSGLPEIATDRLAEIREETRRFREEHEGAHAVEPASEEDEAEDGDEEATPEPRPVTNFGLEWHADGDQLLLQLFSSDNKDRWIVRVDAPAAQVVPEHHLFDEAWINWRYNELGWIPDSDAFWYTSEETGFSRLYRKEMGQDATVLTGDAYTVQGVEVSPDGRWLYYRANAEHPGIYEVHRADARGRGEAGPVTALGGVNVGHLSPDGKRLLIEHSEMDRPVELFVQDAKPGASARPWTDTIEEDYKAIEWVLPEIVPIEGRHGHTIWSKYYPPAAGTPPGGPAVVFVHGAGYTQNSHMGWPYYFREFFFHTLLSQHGYAVLDMDWRASAGYGRDWRTAIYRNMGDPEIDDIEDGIAWMAAEHGIDPERIGMYGGSYGGFISLMTLFKRPQLVQAAAALRPVTDWAHYNHPYTSNILNTPEVDHLAYERSSPIEHAEGLENPLLMCAPMQDDNVHFQDVVRLAQRLIELEKEDWEVAIYPIEPHGFRQPSSWLDEYRRIFKLMETHLK